MIRLLDALLNWLVEKFVAYFTAPFADLELDFSDHPLVTEQDW